MIAHVGAAPVEELLMPLMTVGTGVVVALSVARARLGRRRSRS